MGGDRDYYNDLRFSFTNVLGESPGEGIGDPTVEVEVTRLMEVEMTQLVEAEVTRLVEVEMIHPFQHQNHLPSFFLGQGY